MDVQPNLGITEITFCLGPHLVHKFAGSSTFDDAIPFHVDVVVRVTLPKRHAKLALALHDLSLEHGARDRVPGHIAHRHVNPLHDLGTAPADRL